MMDCGICVCVCLPPNSLRTGKLTGNSPHFAKRPVRTDRVRQAQKQVCEKSTLTTFPVRRQKFPARSLLSFRKFPVSARREFGAIITLTQQNEIPTTNAR